jgi:hypothetical protein
VGRELALCYKEKRQVYRRRGALGVQEELFKPAGMEAAAGLIRAYSMVKDYESRAGTGLLAAERAELRVTAWAMRRTRRGKEQAEEMSGGYFHRHESQNWLPHVVAAIASTM